MRILAVKPLKKIPDIAAIAFMVKPVATSSRLYDATLLNHGPAHNVNRAICEPPVIQTSGPNRHIDGSRKTIFRSLNLSITGFELSVYPCFGIRMYVKKTTIKIRIMNTP